MTSVKLNREYTVDEIFEGLKTTGMPEPYKYQGKIGGRDIGNPMIYVPGAGANDIQITVGKKKLLLVDTPRPADALKSVGKEILEEAVFGQWAAVFRNNNPNKVLEKQIAAECKRLFG